MKTRPTAAEVYKDKISPNGIAYDCPRLPATVLIDDIEEIVISLENVRIGPGYYSYMVNLYPPSHHMR